MAKFKITPVNASVIVAIIGAMTTIIVAIVQLPRHEGGGGDNKPDVHGRTVVDNPATIPTKFQLQGFVFDPQEKPLGGASVKARLWDQTQSGQTDGNGKYTITFNPSLGSLEAHILIAAAAYPKFEAEYTISRDGWAPDVQLMVASATTTSNLNPRIANQLRNIRVNSVLIRPQP